jgi:hypothetical protein
LSIARSKFIALERATPAATILGMGFFQLLQGDCPEAERQSDMVFPELKLGGSDGKVGYLFHDVVDQLPTRRESV